MYNQVPYLSTYYIKPILKPNEDNILTFYVTDASDSYYTYDNKDGYKYKIIVTRENKEDIVMYNVLAGEHTVNLGSYEDEGEYEFSIIARDQYGRFSHELFNFIKVEKEKVYNTYIVTEQDLIDYGIKYNVDREIKLLVDCSDIFKEYTNSNDRITKMKERTLNTVNNYNLPNGKYVVAIPDRDGDGVYKGKNKDGMFYQSVRYSDGYDKEAIELECNNTRLAIQKLLNDKREQGYNKIVMYNAIYTINANIDADKKEQGIRVPNGMDLDLNGSTIKLNPCVGNSTIMLHITDSDDTHVHNGIIEGDYFTHDYTNSTKNSEWVSGIELGGKSTYSSIYDMVVKDITGYGVQNGLSQRGEYGYSEFQVRNSGVFTIGIDIDQTTGEEIENEYRSTSEYVQLFLDGKQHKYVSCSKYLGYQGNGCGTWNIIMHFYDKNKNYIKSVNGYQYRRVRIPDNAYLVRTTILNAIAPTTLTYQYFNVPTHCEFKNIKIENVRCVGVAPSQMKDCLFENIEFTGSGQSSANCAFDAEDGWDGMQDATFKALNFHDNPLNNYLICAGHNFMIIDCPDISSIYCWGRARGTLIKNCKGVKCYHEWNDITRTFRPRFINCEFDNLSTGNTVVRGCKVKGGSGIFINCDIENTLPSSDVIDSNVKIDWSGYIGKGYYDNINFYPLTDGKQMKFSFNDTKANSNCSFNNCIFHENAFFANNNFLYNLESYNCHFKNGFSTDVKVIEGDKLLENYTGVLFEDCIFDNVGNYLIHLTPFAYSLGQVKLKFNRCNINFNKTAKQLIDGISCPSNGSVIEFKDCTFTGADNMTGYSNKYGGLTEEGLDITFIFDNCTGFPIDNFIKHEENKNGQVKIIIK